MRKDSVAHRVMEGLRSDLLDGKIPPGTWLREELIAERFEVGRYTVRSAIEQLVSTGLLVHERNRGAYVSPISPERVKGLFEFRRIIEVGALRIGLDAGADLSKVIATTEVMGTFDEHTPWHTVIEAHNDLHRAVVAMSANPRLLDAYDRYQDDLQFMLAYLGHTHSVDAFTKNHLDLVEQICQGGQKALEFLEFDLSEFGVPPLLEALAGLEDAAQAGHIQPYSSLPAGQPST